MAPDASAYSALGLEPGADARAIERAYKSLIKQHHPDREGGNSARAAEINRAYRELRAALGSKDWLELIDEPVEETRNGWVRAAIGLLVALAALLAITGPVSAYINQLLQLPPVRSNDVTMRGLVASEARVSSSFEGQSTNVDGRRFESPPRSSTLASRQGGRMKVISGVDPHSGLWRRKARWRRWNTNGTGKRLQYS